MVQNFGSIEQQKPKKVISLQNVEEEKVIEEICANFDVNDGKRQKIKINIQEMDEGSVMLSPPMTP